MSRPVTLVTGASAGLGAEFARQCARRGEPLALAARRRDRMEALAAELGGDIHIFEADLARAGAAASLIADVVYDGQLVTLQSSPANVRDDYRAKNPGNELVLGVVATRGTQDDPIELGRITTLQNVLQAISPRSALFENKTLPEPPGLFAPLGVDGAIFLVTNVKAVATTCQSAYRFAAPREIIGDVIKGLADQGQVRDLLLGDPGRAAGTGSSLLIARPSLAAGAPAGCPQRRQARANAA